MRRRLTVTLVLACVALAGAGGRALAGTGVHRLESIAAQSPADTGVAPSASSVRLSTGPALRAELQIGSKRLGHVLAGGLRVRLWTDRRADAIIRLTLARPTAARAHLRAGAHGAGPVTIGLGAVGGLRRGSNRLLVRLPRAISRRLSSMRALRLGVRALVMAAGQRRLVIATAALG